MCQMCQERQILPDPSLQLDQWMLDWYDSRCSLWSYYAEEFVIARAHTTKCWAKINAGVRSPILRQRSASGNVCIHPREISVLATVLPRPMSALYDEIVGIFVSDI